MKWLIKEKSFYKTVALLAIPVSLQNIINLGINLMDTVMIGKLGDIELAATAVGNQYFFILTVLIYGVSSGTTVISSQYYGKGEKDTVKLSFSFAHKLTLILALIFTICGVCFPEFVLSIFTSDQEVIHMGVGYLQLVCLSYGFTALSSCTYAILRSIGSVNISVIVATITLVTNVFWNYVFIFGKLGAPALGVQGAAVGTIIARVQEFIIIAIYLFIIEKELCYKLRDLLRFDRKFVPLYVQTLTPIIINEFLWSTGASMLIIIIGRMSTDFLAANSIVSVITQIVGVAMMGVSNATSIIIGMNIGRGEYERVKIMARTFLIISTVVGVISAGLLLIIRPFVLGFYDNLSDQTLEYVSILLILMSFITFCQTVSMTALMGVLRGSGDARFVLLVEILCMWMIAIPLGYVSAFYIGASVPVVYLVIKSDEIIKLVLGIKRILNGKWINDVTISNENLIIEKREK